MSLVNANTLLPTSTNNERGAATSPAAARTPFGDAKRVPQGLRHTSPGSWGATLEKVALIEPGKLVHRHMHSTSFESIFEAHAPVITDGPSEGNRKLGAVVATNYKDADALGWPNLPGPSVDLVYWVNFLLARNFKCDYLWDGLVEPSDRPTKNVILRFLSDLAACAQPGDEVVIVFSGHGDNSAYIPLGCPINHTNEAVYPADLRASFIDLLQPGVAVLVVWDACNSSNPFAFPWQLDLQDERLAFGSTGFPQSDSERSVVVISAGSGKTFEAELNKEPRVHCGPLCWSSFTFVFYHLKDSIKTADILEAFIKHIRFCFEDRPEVIPQFLSSSGGSGLPTEVLKLLDSLFTPYHPRAVEHLPASRNT